MAEESRPFSHVVVIGASAGGIDALSNLLMTIPAGFAAPIVIAQHLDPSRPSHLRDILSRRSALPVRTVADHEKLEAGVVYVVPSNRHARITDSEVVMRVDGLESPKPSVNLLLTTAASAFGDRLIAVILSGTGTDGAAGARVVKQAGGTVIIQNPETAAYPGMPLALAPTTVDLVADIDRIGPILQDLLTGVEVADRPDEKKMLQAFLTNVRERQGLDFSSYKMPTILRRLQRRIVATDSENLQSYIQYVQRHPEEYQQLVNSFLIKVTEFFRDADLYKVLRESVVPQLIEYARKRGNQLRIWSAGCATGEEAYSLAILFCEALGGALEHYNVRIFATDADLDAITFARRGVYPESALANLPSEYVDRYFTRDENGYHVKKRIRALTVFGQHDLGQRAPFPHIDMVVCRNVLIYFTAELQQRTLHLFAYSLRDGGYLVLGKAETPGVLGEYFHAVDSQHKVYMRHGERMPIPPARFTSSAPPPLKPPFSSRRASANLSTLREQRTGEQVRTPGENLVLQLPVGVITVDRHYDIQTINSAARRMLSIYRPAIGEDLIHIVRDFTSRRLRDAIDTVFRSDTPVEVEEISIEEAANDERRYLWLSCYPQHSDETKSPVEAVMIVVTDITGPVRQRLDLERQLSDINEQLESFRNSADAQTATREALVQRLVETNRQLVESNQELTSANEELRTANEEFLMTAEEAQAAVEEVETLNEELQATNEELETLNEELQSTIEELNTTNDDLNARSTELQQMARASESDRARLAAILSGMGDAVLVVASNGAPLLTNAAYDRMFGGAHASIPALDIDGHSLPPSELPEARAARGESFNMEFTLDSETGERRWFEANGQPIRDGEGGLQWGVLVIRDITERSLRRLQDDFIAMASHELRTPLTPLQTYLQMLQKQFAGDPPDAPTRHYTDAALAQVQRLARLVGDLLDVSRLQSGKYTFKNERIVLNQLVARAVEAAQTLAAGQTIRLDATGTALPIQGDTDRLEQAILNILTNAITYAPGTQHIDVTLRRTRNNAELRIRDYGPGIPATDLPQLFNRFYQAQRTDKSSRPGLGLGLFIAREIVTAHGGDITAETQNGSGTTFIITLPLAPEKSS